MSNSALPPRGGLLVEIMGSSYQRLLRGCYENVEDEGFEPHIDLITIHQEILLSYRLIFAYNAGCQKVLMSTYPYRVQIGPHAADSSLLCRLTTVKDNWWMRFYRHLTGTRNGVHTLPQKVWPDWARDAAGCLAEQEQWCRDEFAFFGRRLLIMQEFNNRRSPSTLRGMWQDRRNRREWITFWAVLVVGGMSLIFAVIQIALAIWQGYR